MEVPQKPQSEPTPKWLVFAMLGLSFAGFLDATYLTAKHYLGFEIPCTILNGCEQVLSSQYASIFGIPVALFGAVYYLAVLVLIVAFLDRKNAVFLKGAVLLPIGGFLATLWFVFAQIVLLNALCFYCLVSGLLTTSLFALSVYFIWHGYFEGFRRNGNI